MQTLPQLTIDPEVKTEIEQAVVSGKTAIVSQHDVTIGNWTGVGYVILDPETGAGMYQISGGANGAFLAGILFGLLIPFLLVFGFVATSPALILILSAIAIPYLGLVDDSPYFAALREAIYADPACVWTGFSLGIGLGSLLVPELKIVAEAAKIIGRVLGITALILPLIGPTKMYNEC